MQAGQEESNKSFQKASLLEVTLISFSLSHSDRLTSLLRSDAANWIVLFAKKKKNSTRFVTLTLPTLVSRITPSEGRRRNLPSRGKVVDANRRARICTNPPGVLWSELAPWMETHVDPSISIICIPNRENQKTAAEKQQSGFITSDRWRDNCPKNSCSVKKKAVFVVFVCCCLVTLNWATRLWSRGAACFVSAEKIPSAAFRSSNYSLGRRSGEGRGGAVISMLAAQRRGLVITCVIHLVSAWWPLLFSFPEISSRKTCQPPSPPTSREPAAVWLFQTALRLFVLAVGHWPLLISDAAGKSQALQKSLSDFLWLTRRLQETLV